MTIPFSALMAALGPWPRDRRIAVAVSGGADSLCLAYLASDWGTPLALIVDHGLREESAAEVLTTANTLTGLGVGARILTLKGLAPGPGLAARARAARYAALTEATLAAGLTDLLLGHHAGDQGETLLLRSASRSGANGLAGMASIAESAILRLIRPLLGVPPGKLRDILRAKGIAWVEDPSNSNAGATRNRLRAKLADPAGDGPAIATLLRRAQAFGLARREADNRIAATLAERATIFPEGFAVLTPGPIEPDCLGALIRALTGAPYPAGGAALGRLAAGTRLAGTLGGVRLLPAGCLGPGTLLVREPAAMQRAIVARPGCVWDRRFILDAPKNLPATLCLGAVGSEARLLRRHTDLPAAVLQTLPALRDGDHLLAVPHLGHFKGWTNSQVRLTFCPSTPAAGAPFAVFAMGDAVPEWKHHVLDDANVAHPGKPGEPGPREREPAGL